MLTSKLNKIVLCATANNLVAGLWHADKLQHSETFANTPEGNQGFADFLTAHPGTHVYLLANAVEEDYRLESLPHSTGKAKKELINRKLNQFYRGLEYRAAHFIMREKDKRKDDKFLFVALNNDDFLQNWVQILKEIETRLVGVYLLPMLSRILVTEFKLNAPHILLCEKLSSGVRQTYFHNGRLRMSRLIPTVPEDENQLGYFYLVETQKTRLYLLSKRFISRDVTLNLQLVNLADDVSQIQQNFSHEPGIDCEVIDLAGFAKSLHLDQNALKAVPELLHMQQLATANLVDNLAPDALTKHFRLNKISRWLKTLALILAISGLLIGAWYLVAGFRNQTAFTEAKQATNLEQLKYNEVAKSFPTTEISAGDLKVAVTLDQTLAGFPQSPRRMMLAISRGLDQFPDIVLTNLRWLQSGDLAIQDTGIPADQINIKNAENALKLAPNQLAEIAFVTAEVANFDGNYRNAIQLVNTFSSVIRQDPSVAYVEVVETPINLNSYTDLHGSTTDKGLSDIEQAASFKLKVILKPQH